jgi:putative endopeptidase
MLELAGIPSSQARSDAGSIYQIEATLASFQLAPDEMGNPFKLYNKLDLSGLQNLAPQLPWQQFLNGMGYPSATQLNVQIPSYFSSMSAFIASVNPSSYQTYVRWCAINALSPYLTSEFVERDFDFYGKVLSGLTEAPPRAQVCAKETDQALGDQTGA